VKYKQVNSDRLVKLLGIQTFITRLRSSNKTQNSFILFLNRKRLGSNFSRKMSNIDRCTGSDEI
jgi:hypothetical protein